VDGDFDVVEEARAIGGAEPGKDGEAADGNETSGGGDAFALLAARLIYVQRQHKYLDRASGLLNLMLDEPRLKLLAARLGVRGAMAQGARSIAARLAVPGSGMRYAVDLTMVPGEGALVTLSGAPRANTWWPSTLVPKIGATEADAQPWLDHARALIPIEAERGRVLDRLAWALQHLGRKINSALILVGEGYVPATVLDGAWRAQPRGRAGVEDRRELQHLP
jgi:hypothetical protein